MKLVDISGRKYLIAKVNELETKHKNKNIRDLYRGISDFQKGYQPRTNIVKDEKGDCLQTPTVFWLGTISVSYWMYMELMMLGRQKYTQQNHWCVNRVPMRLSWLGVEQLALRSTNLLILFEIRKNCQRSGRSRSLYLSIRRAIKQIVVVIEAYHFCQLHTKFYPTSCCQGQLHMQRKLLGIINVDFDATGQLLIYFAFIKYLSKKWEYSETAH